MSRMSTLLTEITFGSLFQTEVAFSFQNKINSIVPQNKTNQKAKTRETHTMEVEDVEVAKDVPEKEMAAKYSSEEDGTKDSDMKPDNEKPVDDFVYEDVGAESPTNTIAQTARVVVCGIAFIIGLVLCFVELDDDRKISQTAAIAIWMAALWLTELIPLHITALFPIFLFPMFGIEKSSVITAKYAGNTIFLFIAGFMVALTLERWNIHKRISLKILSWCGSKPGPLLFGMMASTFILSMFVSNTATALMMVPNAISVCQSLERNSAPEHRHEQKRFGTAAMLGIAYAANVGGLSTLIGTPPNLVFHAQLEELYPDAPDMTFADWIGFGVPLGIIFFILIWAYLFLMYLRNFKGEVQNRSMFAEEYVALGPWSFEQISVGLLFLVMALLWIFRKDLEFGGVTIQGWSNIFPAPKHLADATIGMLIAVILFLTPARPCMLADAPQDANQGYTTTLLDWDTIVRRFPWDIVLLFGGGFALAAGFVSGGLSGYLGDKLGGMDVSLEGQVFLVTFVIVWLTELTSNTATSNIMIPIAASIAYGSAVSPYTFMIPTALACSCAFALPIATPPNLVVYASGKIPMTEMNRAGVFLNIICPVIILGATFTIIPAILGVDADEFPEWAASATF